MDSLRRLINNFTLKEMALKLFNHFPLWTTVNFLSIHFCNCLKNILALKSIKGFSFSIMYYIIDNTYMIYKYSIINIFNIVISFFSLAWTWISIFDARNAKIYDPKILDLEEISQNHQIDESLG